MVTNGVSCRLGEHADSRDTDTGGQADQTATETVVRTQMETCKSHKQYYRLVT